MTSAAQPLIWLACAGTVAAIVLRPRGIPEWIWAVGAALLLVVVGVLPPAIAWRGVADGADVYAFLGGMMVLAELARREGVFEWLAAVAARLAAGSAMRLFAIVYFLGVAVTVVLSNDATAVVLTPAVAAVARRARANPVPLVLACAFVANAASFVLPISNPANLVVFGTALPRLDVWLRTFALPSIVAIVVTFGLLAFLSRNALRESLEVADVGVPGPLSGAGRVALGAIAGAALVLALASARGLPLGLATLACACLALALVAASDRGAIGGALRGVSFSTLALVAGLFVLANAVDRGGVLSALARALDAGKNLGGVRSALALGIPTALFTNLTNNLPAALLASHALAHATHGAQVRGAIAIAIDLGPNLATSGSLATILWLSALQREGIAVSRVAFFRAGAVVMPAALVLALLALPR